MRRTRGIGVRWILLLTLVLFLLFHLACDWATAPLKQPDAVNDWVRTVDGWEKPSTWWISKPLPAPLHPLLVAVFELLTTLLALVGLSTPKGKSHTHDLVSTHPPNQPAHFKDTDCGQDTVNRQMAFDR